MGFHTELEVGGYEMLGVIFVVRLFEQKFWGLLLGGRE